VFAVADVAVSAVDGVWFDIDLNEAVYFRVEDQYSLRVEVEVSEFRRELVSVSHPEVVYDGAADLCVVLQA